MDFTIAFNVSNLKSPLQSLPSQQDGEKRIMPHFSWSKSGFSQLSCADLHQRTVWSFYSLCDS